MLHLQVNGDRQLTEQSLTVVEGDLDAHVFQKELAGVAELVKWQLVLLVGLIIHDHVVLAIVVQVGHVAAVDVSGLHLHASVESLVRYLARDHVLELGTHESWALARLHMLKLDNLLQLVVDLQNETVLEISGICHEMTLPNYL